MAEEESELELDRFQKELESLLQISANDEHGLQSKSYCSRFCELVEEHTSLWQVPLPQLEVLRSALCAFVCGAASFPSDCEHVRYTLSSLALSVFELLLFFAKDEFPEHPLKDILDSFQECHSSLVRYQNVYLLQVRQIIKDGGPWASPVLQGILKELDQPQVEVDRYLSSEVSVFFELRVRYLLACERTQEAMALAQRCSQHSTAGRNLFFKQAYLSCLWKASQQEQLFKEMAEIDGKDAVDILCNAEKEEKDELLLELSRGFLLQQLRSGDMYYLWDLVFIWCKLYLRLKACKEELLEECKLLILSATNIKAIFPFIKLILEENLGKDGLTFCIELCARALQTDLKSDPFTKSLIYKTIAYLLPSDLEICRACALLVFFLECTVEAFKTVFLLYTHPDQEYHLDNSPIGNDVRFEVIQILKKGLFFDPEFWSLLNIKTNCLKLMSDQVAKAALCEIMEEDKWVPNYCARGHCKCRAEQERTLVKPMVNPASTNKQESETVEKRPTTPPVDASSEVLPYKRRGRRPGSHIAKDLETCPPRRSFRQLDLAQNHSRQLNDRRQRFLTRQTDKKTLKRRGRKPRWLLEELASQAENSVPRQGKKPGRKPKQLNVLKDISVDTPIIEISSEFSYPDNEVSVSTDIRSQPISIMTSTTEPNFDDSKFSCQRTPTRSCDETPNSHVQVASEESPSSWKERTKDTEELVLRAQDFAIYMRKFHTYAKVPEEGESTVDDKVLITTHDAEQTRQVPAPLKNDPREPVRVIRVAGTEPTSVTPTVTQAVSVPLGGTVDANEVPVLETHPALKLSSVTPVNAVGQGTAVNTPCTVDPPRDEATISMADTTSIPDNAPEIAGDKILSCNNTHDGCTDHISPSEAGLEKATDCAPAPENAAETAVHTTPLSAISLQRTTDTISVPEKGTKGYENASNLLREMTHVSENASVVAGSPKMFAEEKAQEPEAHQSDKNEVPCTNPPKTNSSNPAPSPQNVVQLVHRCGLCNKEYRNASILRHAFWHYRLERKCMFCQNLRYIRGPLCHFKKHIKQLKVVVGLAEEKKCESIPEVTAKPDAAVQATVPKKARPGLEQIRSSLLMRLNFKRKTAPHAAENTEDTDIRTLKQSLTKKSISVQKHGEKEENNEESVQKNKRRYFTRGLVRKSESKGRFLRNRLARKAKTRTSKADRDVSVPKDNPVHTLNGVIRKKRSPKHVQGESNHVTDKDVQVTTKQENKEQKPGHVGTNEKAESKVKCDGNAKSIKTGSTNAEEKRENSPEAKVKSLQKPGMNKKKNTLAKENEDAEPVKKRRLDTGINEQKQDERNSITEPKPPDERKSVEASVSNTTKQENGTGKQSRETSQQLQKIKKQVRATPSVVKCPREICTFHARPGPVLSHVLIHHPDDTKALEFFYDLAKQKCLFCGRRIWTPQHFFDHVVSHRGNLKHPCYHADCNKRFKTRLELGDHMLKDHQPLRAVCCFPGCKAQVSNLKFLYSHERDHYHVVQKKAVCKQDKSDTSKVLPGAEDVDETSPTAASPKNTLVETQQMPESTETAAPQTQSDKGSEQESNAASAKDEDEMSLTLNKSSVNYTSKSPRLVNGHIDYDREAFVKPNTSALKEQESDLGKMSTKPFVRPPPSAYLDELYISMPKRWKGSQVSPKGSHSTEVSPVKRQICPRCSASFGGEDEMQEHRVKCTSLFGFDSDDESAS